MIGKLFGRRSPSVTRRKPYLPTFDQLEDRVVPNSMPVITNPGAQHVVEGTTVSLQIAASADPSGSALSYTIGGLMASLPASVSLGASTGLISGFVDYDAVTNYPGGTIALYPNLIVAQGTYSATQGLTWFVTDTQLLQGASFTVSEGQAITEDPRTSAGQSASGLTYSLSAGSFGFGGPPAGVSINPSTGVITGPVAFSAVMFGSIASFSATVTASDGGSVEETAVLSWTVNVPTFVQGSYWSVSEGQTVTDDARTTAGQSASGLTYSVSGTLPTGLGLSSAGQVTGAVAYGAVTGAVSTTYSATLAAVTGTFTQTAGLSWVVAKTSLLQNVNPTVSEGQNITIDPRTSAGQALSGLTYSLNSGSIPAGLSLNTSSGLIIGAPAYTDVISASLSGYLFEVQAVTGTLTESALIDAMVVYVPLIQNVSATVSEGQAVISDPRTSAGQSASGLTYSVIGTVPPGLSLSSAGQITNTVNYLAVSIGTSATYGETLVVATGTYSETASLSWVVLSETPVVQFSPASYSPSETAGSAALTVTLPAQSSNTITVHYATSNGTALSGLDYTSESGNLTFAPGATAESFTVPLLDDTSAAASGESFTVNLSSPSNATLGVSHATVAIVNDLYWNGPSVSWSMSPTANPSITAIASQSTSEGVSVSLAVSASDPGSYSLTYAAVNLPTGLTISPSTGVIAGTVAYTAAEDFGGTYTPTVIVSDGHGGSADESFDWAIADTPRAPTMTSPGSQSDAAGDSVSLQIAATDPDGNLFSYDAENLPSGLSIDPDSGLITGTIDPSAASPTAYSAVISADDGIDSVSETFSWTVTAINQAPQLTSPGNQSDATGDVVGLSLTAVDPSGNPLTFRATNLPAGLSIDPGSGNITGTIATSISTYTTYSVTLTASDGSLQGSQALTWVVSPVGVPNPGPQDNVAGGSVSLSVAGTNSGGGTISYSVTGLPTGLSVNSSTGLISGTVGNTADASSPYSPTITATNGTTTVTTELTWTVEHLALANPGNQFNREGTTVSLSQTVTDAAGDTLTYSATGLPSGVSINSSTGAITGTVGLSAHAASPYQVTLTVTGGGKSASQSFIWTVTPQVALANPGPQNDAGGESVSLQVSATGLAGGSLSYSVTGLPSGLSINASSGLISGIIPTTAISSSPYAVTVTANNGTATVTQVYPWSVVPLNLPTTADQENFDGDTVSLALGAEYHGSGGLTYSVTGLPTGLSVNASTGIVAGTVGVTADVSGPYLPTVTVVGGSTTVSESLNWAIDQVVSLDSIDDQTNVGGTSASLAVTATDAHSAGVTYSLSGQPSGVTINSSTGVIAGTIAPSAANTTPYTVTVTAHDSTFSEHTTFDWTVSHLALANPGPLSAVDGISVSIALSADDAAGSSVTFSATGLPSGLSINASTGLISGTLGSTDDTDSGYLVAVSASDGTYSDTQDITFDVSKVGMGLPADQTNQEGDSGVSLQIYAATITGTLSYSAAGLPDGLSINSSTGLITGTIAAGTAAEGPFTVTIAVNNGTNAASQQFTWNVNPVVAVTAIADQTNAEGGTVSLAVSAIDANSSTLSYSAAGLPAGLSISSSTGLISGTVTSGDALAGPAYPVAITVTDGTYATIISFNWQITNPSATAPVLTSPGAQANQPGDNVDFFVTATDAAGLPLSFSADNLPDGLIIVPSTGEIFGTIADDAVASTVFSASVTIADGQGGTDTKTFDWTITPAPLTATAGSSISAVEGIDTSALTLATFTTPDLNAIGDDFTAVVKWGDGTTDVRRVHGSNGSFTVTDHHVYATSGSYSVITAITEDTGAVATTTTTATVADATLALAGMTLGAIANQSSTLTLAALTDGNPDSTASDFTVTISWGDDSSSSAGTLASGGNGSYQLMGTHAYTADGTYTTTITVTDVDGATASTSSTVVVGNLFAGVPSTMTVATFGVADPSATPAGFTATITWGDGTSSSGTITKSGGIFIIIGSHTYTVDSIDETGGVYQVSVAVADIDGSSLIFGKPVEVVRPPISLLLNKIAPGSSGSLTNVLLGTLTEANTSDASTEFSVTVDWGDGSSPSNATLTGSNGSFQIWGSHTYSVSTAYPITVAVSQGWSTQALAVAQTFPTSIARPPPYVSPALRAWRVGRTPTWTGPYRATIDGNNISFNARTDWFNNNDSLQVLNQVAIIQNAITHILGNLANYTVPNHANETEIEKQVNHWFGNGAALTAAQITKVRRVFQDVENGIDNNTTVYIDSSFDYGGWGKVVDNWFSPLYHQVQLGEKYFNGNQSRQIATLIHELTHAYAGTDDNGYYDDPESFVGGHGVTYHDRDDAAIRLTPAQQVNNADSYAGFLVNYYL